MLTNPTQRRGFTLIELLLVISIIAVLIAMTLPTLAAARRSAQSVQCGNNMKSLMLVTTTYAFESKSFLPYTNSASGEAMSNPDRWSGAGWLYKGPINTGLGNDYSEERREEGVLWELLGGVGETYHCPLDDAVNQDTNDTRNMSSYVMNRAINGWNETLPERPAHSYDAFRLPADSVVMWEGDETFSDPVTQQAGMAGTGHWNDGNNDPDSQGPSVRHNASGTIGFLDGHVESWSWLTYFEIAFDTNANELYCNPTTTDGRQPVGP